LTVEKETRTYRLFIFYVGLVICLALSGIFIGTAIQARRLIFDEILSQGRAYFNNIVITRKWNSDYGGVYVEKTGGMRSNPYLKDPDITTVDGKVYTKKNPSLMTREISGYASTEGLFSFHLTSLNLLNPDNRPDEFEAEALRSFEKGKKEAYEKAAINGRTHFRYMAPLFMEESCLRCHGEQGYKAGDVRGGISVTFDIENIQSKLTRNLYVILFLGIASIVLLLGVVYLFERNLIRKLAEARKLLVKFSITDELTGLFNRRHVIKRFAEEFERAKRTGEDLGCILIDIDNFKSINDAYGHIIGDKVLRAVSEHFQRMVRAYDIPGRYGGEEFIIVMPDTDPAHAVALAERIRETIKDGLAVKTGMPEYIAVAISAGVTGRLPGDASIDDIIKRADDALYEAKEAGRDRVARR
jgi:diguanylate cyclase (GGDEF)-like protein